MKLILLPLILLFVAGCTPLGKSEFTCTDSYEHAGCTSARNVYHMSDGGANPARSTTKKFNDQEPSESVHRDPVVDTYVTPHLPDRPIPVRTPSQVMRIWVATWEAEESGALMAPGLIYTEIEPRRWVIGKPESGTNSTQSFRPLSKSSKTSN